LANVYLNPESITGISPASRPKNRPGRDWSEQMNPSPGEISTRTALLYPDEIKLGTAGMGEGEDTLAIKPSFGRHCPSLSSRS
jgi:hypothetical protein